MNQTENDFITAKAAILRELLKSRSEGTTLGIWSTALGTGMFLCTVNEVCTDEDEEDIMIMLKENEFTSPHVNTHVVYLCEIDRVFSFKSPNTVKPLRRPITES